MKDRENGNGMQLDLLPEALKSDFGLKIPSASSPSGEGQSWQTYLQKEDRDRSPVLLHRNQDFSNLCHRTQEMTSPPRDSHGTW